MEKKFNKEDSDSFSIVISVNRVTKVTKGGKRFGFSAVVISGDKNSNIGIGIGKSREVSSAISKATSKAKKSRVKIAIHGTTIPYRVIGRHGSSKVIMRTAAKGTGIIAGGPVRSIMEVVGIKDILAKSIGSANHQNVAKATLNGLIKLRSLSHIAKLRGQTTNQIIRGKDVEVE